MADASQGTTPTRQNQPYRSVYKRPILQNGLFVSFELDVTFEHTRTGYWRFVGNDRVHGNEFAAYIRGFTSPEGVIVAELRDIGSTDEIQLYWHPGTNDTHPWPRFGNARHHLTVIDEELQKLGTPANWGSSMPVYPCDPEKKLASLRKSRLQRPPKGKNATTPAPVAPPLGVNMRTGQMSPAPSYGGVWSNTPATLASTPSPSYITPTTRKPNPVAQSTTIPTPPPQPSDPSPSIYQPYMGDASLSLREPPALRLFPIRESVEENTLEEPTEPELPKLPDLVEPPVDYFKQGLTTMDDNENTQEPPQQTPSEEIPPEQTSPKQTSPEQTSPEQTSPEETPPEETPPEETPPEETPPEQTSPEQTPPQQTSPQETPSEQPNLPSLEELDPEWLRPAYEFPPNYWESYTPIVAPPSPPTMTILEDINDSPDIDVLVQALEQYADEYPTRVQRTAEYNIANDPELEDIYHVWVVDRPEDDAELDYATLPCMECGEMEDHKQDCNIGSIEWQTVEWLTVEELEEIARAVRGFDPGPMWGEAGEPAEWRPLFRHSDEAISEAEEPNVAEPSPWRPFFREFDED